MEKKIGGMWLAVGECEEAKKKKKWGIPLELGHMQIYV